MRKLLSTIGLFTIIANLVIGQWSGTSLDGNTYRNGNVGIGAENPLEAFHLRKDLDNDIGPVLLLQNGQYENSNGAGSSIKFIGTDQMMDRYIQMEAIMRNHSKPDHLSFVFNNDGTIVKPFTIKSSGRIGIGTESPLEAFHLRKDLDNDIGPVLLLQNGQYENSNGAGSSIKFIGTDQMMDRYIQMEAIMRGNSMPEHLSFVFNNDGTIIKPLTIKHNGNVAIQGKLEAKEIKVKLSPTADFVFENNYPLKSIEEVEAYIKENKHLPDIPSAKEIKTNGVNIAVMNTKLLQKIEELTLYTIAQQKEIEKLQEQNSKIDKLEKMVHELKQKQE